MSFVKIYSSLGSLHGIVLRFRDKKKKSELPLSGKGYPMPSQVVSYIMRLVVFSLPNEPSIRSLAWALLKISYL